jgi:hypothetical protein
MIYGLDVFTFRRSMTERVDGHCNELRVQKHDSEIEMSQEEFNQ